MQAEQPVRQGVGGRVDAGSRARMAEHSQLQRVFAGSVLALQQQQGDVLVDARLLHVDVKE